MACTRRIRITWMTLVVLALFAGQCGAGISVSPAALEVSLDEGRPSGRFVITNTGDSEERFRVRSSHFTYDENGTLRQIAPDERSLAEWIKFNPKEFTLPAKSKRVVRFVVIPRGKLENREYWAAMELESLNTTTARGEDAGGRKFNVEIVPSVMVPIFGHVGEIEYAGVIADLTVADSTHGPMMRIVVENQGDGRLWVDGTYSIADGQGGVVKSGDLPRGYVMPQTKRAFASYIREGLPQGEYTLSVDYGGTGTDVRMTAQRSLSWK